MTPDRRTFLQQLGFAGAGLGLVSFLPGCQTPHAAASRAGLPRSTPEAEGVSSAGILAFLDAIAKSKHELHSLMILRHGKVITEGWWAPYGPQYTHTMYSMSKSFTSTAVGFAVSEGRLSVDDRVVSFFPDQLPEKVSDNLAAMKVKHLLMMAAGNEKEPTGTVVKEENWVKTFLAQNYAYAPGSVFLYNSAATYMCSAIVQKLIGQKIVDYLRPRLFDPLGVEQATWEECPRGINTGGWGLNIQTETMAKFGQLYLQKGLWNGRQVIPAKWVEEATTFKIQQPAPAKPTRPNAENDWLQGYCYQFWRSQNNAFRGDGAFGQFTVVLPEQDAVVIMTSETGNMQGELDLVWEHLLPAMKSGALVADAKAQSKLSETLKNLALPVPDGKVGLAGKLPTGKFVLEENSTGFRSGALEIGPNLETILTLTDAKQSHVIRFGPQKWFPGVTSLPGTPPRIIAGSLKPDRPRKVVGSAALNRSGVELTLRYYETPHHDTITCAFNGNNVEITFLSSIAKLRNTKDTRPVLKGTVIA